MSEARYSVIRYMPDPGRGESLNIGILLWDKESAEYQLSFDQNAIDRVVRENPYLERDSLLYIEPELNKRLSSAMVPAPARIEAILENQNRFPLEITEPRLTTIEPTDGLDATAARLLKRIVRPRRRHDYYRRPIDQMTTRLQPFITSKAISRSYVFEGTKTGVTRSADFYANSGANIALDIVRLALKKADNIRLRADAEAFKVYDVLGGDAAVNDYVVYCQLSNDSELSKANRDAQKILEAQGAHVLTDLDEAASVLSDAAAK